MRSLSNKKHSRLDKVRELQRINPFVKAAYNATANEIDALCISIIELHNQNKCLVELLYRSNKMELSYVNVSADAKHLKMDKDGRLKKEPTKS